MLTYQLVRNSAVDVSSKEVKTGEHDPDPEHNAKIKLDIKINKSS